jgi:hypothetical protein
MKTLIMIAALVSPAAAQAMSPLPPKTVATCGAYEVRYEGNWGMYVLGVQVSQHSFSLTKRGNERDSVRLTVKDVHSEGGSVEGQRGTSTYTVSDSWGRVQLSIRLSDGGRTETIDCERVR